MRVKRDDLSDLVGDVSREKLAAASLAAAARAVACVTGTVFAYESAFFRIMSHQFPEDLATVNMNSILAGDRTRELSTRSGGAAHVARSRSADRNSGVPRLRDARAHR